MTPLSVLFIKVTFTWEGVATAVSDGSSLSMVLSAADLCLLISFGGSQVVANTPSNPQQ